MGFFFAVYLFTYGQTKVIGDSLELLYTQGTYNDQDKLKILKELAVNHSDVEKRLLYSELLIKSAIEIDSPSYLFQGYLEKGTSLRVKGDLTNALESYFEGAKIAEKLKKKDRLGAIRIAIADVYSIMGNHKNAVKYHQDAIQILREEKDSINIATALLNAGDEYTNIGNLDSAITYTVEAKDIFEKINYLPGQAYSLGNLGIIYAKLGMDLKAEYHLNQAILILENLKDYYAIAVYLTYVSDIYLEKSERALALNYARLSLELAYFHGMKKEVSDAYLKLSKIYEQMGNTEEAFKFYKNHITYKDSVNNITTVQQMADLRTDFEVSKKQIEVDLLNQQKKTQQIIVIATIVALVLICMLAIGLYRRYLYIRKTQLIIEEERNRSDELLLNILPKETASELKLNGKVKAQRFESVTVMFADFKGFTQYAEQLQPETLVKRVDYYFSKFDEIMEKYGLEKIKTVGDAYMCAGGLPFPSKNHPSKMVQAAIEIAQFVEEAKFDSMQKENAFDVRIGINTGPVVAGVVGTKKFAYDIWGDTVNIAARMESSSETGRINVSENTYALVKAEFDCEYRGEIDAKNRGMLKMYYVKAKKENTSTVESTI
ncbi:MAG TPA: adenylate/guanylate cyclase domain-containing protein [Cyclobacteriaceae bacterium]